MIGVRFVREMEENPDIELRSGSPGSKPARHLQAFAVRVGNRSDILDLESLKAVLDNIEMLFVFGV